MRAFHLLCILVLSPLQPLCFSQSRPGFCVADRKWSLLVREDGKLDYGNFNGNNTLTQTGVNYPGALYGYELPGLPSKFVLVAGRNLKGAGVIQCWENKPGSGSFRLRGSVQFPGDFVGVAYDVERSRVYVLSCRPKVIWFFTWDGKKPLPTMGWTLFATPSRVPELEESIFYDLSIDSTRKMHRLELGLREEFAIGISGRILLSGNGLQDLNIIRNPQGRISSGFDVDRNSMNEGGRTIVVSGKEGLHLELLSGANGRVIGSAKIGSAGKEKIFSSEEFKIGGLYCVRRAGSPSGSGDLFKCYRRYGFSEEFSNGVKIGITPHPLACFVGSDDTLFWIPIYRKNGGSTTIFVQGFMGVAYRDNATGLDPVIKIGKKYFLNTSNYLVVSGAIFSGSWQGGVCCGLPIPDDPILVGRVMLVQFLFEDSGKIKVSNILGVRLDRKEDAFPPEDK